ncbi:hypothetical protein [Massilia yuzhufengensis]|uniref:DUF4175 domain-containing protein n=1 Tax=Massilia yuzhufengensis TaxID=1164594 RepID=A0A1I1TSV3_9BURK|nr:hypothetical protein [Massilia yuzhufengensis]SFD61604.1 hypothetical protein SAMN05216204_13024 [Massilia yuzhufengensis]
MKPKYWFPARSPEHGWGWGLPQAWQGWVVFIGFFVLLAAGAAVLLPQRAFSFMLLVTVLVALLIFICAKKGEPPGAFPRR